MRGTLHVSTNLGLAGGQVPGTFKAWAEVVLDDHEDVRTGILGRHRANAVARAFEDALNAANLAVVQSYVRQHSSGTLTVLAAARILDRAGVRP